MGCERQSPRTLRSADAEGGAGPESIFRFVSVFAFTRSRRGGGGGGADNYGALSVQGQGGYPPPTHPPMVVRRSKTSVGYPLLDDQVAPPPPPPSIGATPPNKGKWGRHPSQRMNARHPRCQCHEQAPCGLPQQIRPPASVSLPPIATHAHHPLAPHKPPATRGGGGGGAGTRLKGGVAAAPRREVLEYAGPWIHPHITPVPPPVGWGGGGEGSIRRGARGGGIWDPKVRVPKMAQPDFPDGTFRFSHDGHFGPEGGGGVFLRCTAILMLPCPPPRLQGAGQFPSTCFRLPLNRFVTASTCRRPLFPSASHRLSRGSRNLPAFLALRRSPGGGGGGSRCSGTPATSRNPQAQRTAARDPPGAVPPAAARAPATAIGSPATGGPSTADRCRRAIDALPPSTAVGGPSAAIRHRPPTAAMPPPNGALRAGRGGRRGGGGAGPGRGTSAGEGPGARRGRRLSSG